MSQTNSKEHRMLGPPWRFNSQFPYPHPLHKNSVHTSSRKVLQHLPTYPPNRFDWHVEFLAHGKPAGLGTAHPPLPFVRGESKLPTRGSKRGQNLQFQRILCYCTMGLQELATESSEITLGLREGRVCLEPQGE